MEPDLGGQEKELILNELVLIDPVAMEPDLGGREKVDGMAAAVVTAPPSQWSLTLEVRKSFPIAVGIGTRRHVAMEPDLGGQEKPGLDHPTHNLGYPSQWSLTLEVRKRSG